MRMINYAIILATMILFSGNSDDNPGNWRVVNDGVMGGLSKGILMDDADGNLMFSGKISLENNGGFSSIRYPVQQIDITGKTHFLLEVKGDGNRYQFRVKKNQQDYYSYISYFNTSGDWEKIIIPLESLKPSFRGRSLNMENFSAEKLSEIGLLIGNKKEQSFELRIKSVELH